MGFNSHDEVGWVGVGVNTCSKVKGRWLPPRCVPSIHILSCHQAPHSRDVSMLAAFEQIPERISRRERDGFLGSQGSPGGCWHHIRLGPPSQCLPVGLDWLAATTNQITICRAGYSPDLTTLLTSNSVLANMKYNINDNSNTQVISGDHTPPHCCKLEPHSSQPCVLSQGA